MPDEQYQEYLTRRSLFAEMFKNEIEGAQPNTWSFARAGSNQLAKVEFGFVGGTTFAEVQNRMEQVLQDDD